MYPCFSAGQIQVGKLSDDPEPVGFYARDDADDGPETAHHEFSHN